MKKFNWLFGIVFLFVIASMPVVSQNAAGTLVEYVPAPGQHINIAGTGTPSAAQKMTESISSLVSLGSFGGYIVLKFDNACLNRASNPYGIDFTVFGNAFAGSSEPGTVWVMQDANQNGLPDDTWYEIAGSSHFFNSTVKDYGVTYFKTSTRDVVWKDNMGRTGRIRANEFNLQEYYPSARYFTVYPPDSVYFTGTLVKNEFERSASGEIRISGPVFGYADSHPRIQDIDLSLPDNPYTNEIEGAGGDPVDISWAVDSTGMYVDLDSIHFVKIESASLNDAGWLGEISTDVAWVQAVANQPQVTGKETLLVMDHYPSKVILGDSLKLEACYFVRGRITGEQVVFNSLNNNVASVDSSGMLRTHSKGEVQILMSAGEESGLTTLKVAVPGSIKIKTDFSAVYPGDTIELAADVYDEESEKINLIPRFFTAGNSIGEILTIGDKTYLVALQPGEITLTATVDNFDVEVTSIVKVLSPDNKLNVFLSVKTAEENLLPYQSVEVGISDLNGWVENRQNDYSGLDKVTLFHALVKGLQAAGVPFKFRDDEAAGGNLYLYMTEQDGLFSYGWGGKTNPAAYARAWIARVNNSQFMNGFNNVPISDGDTIILYHVADILSDWSFTRFFSGSYTVEKGEGVDVFLEQAVCRFYGGEIIESGFFPVENAKVEAGNVGYTDQSGRVWIVPEGEFPLVVSSGNDAFLLAEELTVGVPVTSYAYALYPNPAGDWLVVKGISSGALTRQYCSIKLAGTDGTVVLNRENLTVPVRLDLSGLTPGMYQLIIADDVQPEIHKIIKR